MAGSKSKFLTFLNTKTALKTESKFYQAGSFFRKKCNCIQLLVNGMEYLYRTICHILPLLVHTWSIYGIFILLNTHRILPQISTTTRVKYLATVGEGQSMIWPIDPPDVQEKWKKIILPDILIPKTQEFLKLFAVGLFLDCCCCFSFFFPGTSTSTTCVRGHPPLRSGGKARIWRWNSAIIVGAKEISVTCIFLRFLSPPKITKEYKRTLITLLLQVLRKFEDAMEIPVQDSCHSKFHKSYIPQRSLPTTMSE